MSDKRYICIDSNTLEVRLLTRRSSKNVCFPLHQDVNPTSLHLENQDTLQGIVYREVLYPYQYRLTGDDPKKVAYSLIPRDSWLVALAYIAFEGIIQGWAWDAAKAYMKQGLAQMQALGVAPKTKREGKPTSRKFRTGFVWSSFSGDDELHELFVGLQQVHSKLPSEQQKIVPSTELHNPIMDDLIEVITDGKNRKKAKARLKKYRNKKDGSAED